MYKGVKEIFNGRFLPQKYHRIWILGTNLHLILISISNLKDLQCVNNKFMECTNCCKIVCHIINSAELLVYCILVSSWEVHVGFICKPQIIKFCNKSASSHSEEAKILQLFLTPWHLNKSFRHFTITFIIWNFTLSLPGLNNSYYRKSDE